MEPRRKGNARVLRLTSLEEKWGTLQGWNSALCFIASDCWGRGEGGGDNVCRSRAYVLWKKGTAEALFSLFASVEPLWKESRYGTVGLSIVLIFLDFFFFKQPLASYTDASFFNVTCAIAFSKSLKSMQFKVAQNGRTQF